MTGLHDVILTAYPAADVFLSRWAQDTDTPRGAAAEPPERGTLAV
ncbi:hypothetical protein [Streptomyces sp. NBC_01233]|nr:hypothetical protein OG332_40515 [Streptomyces sp. NBC_01233]